MNLPRNKFFQKLAPEKCPLKTIFFFIKLKSHMNKFLSGKNHHNIICKFFLVFFKCETHASTKTELMCVF